MPIFEAVFSFFSSGSTFAGTLKAEFTDGVSRFVILFPRGLFAEKILLFPTNRLLLSSLIFIISFWNYEEGT